jgi:hypothetical protein
VWTAGDIDQFLEFRKHHPATRIALWALPSSRRKYGLPPLKFVLPDQFLAAVHTKQITEADIWVSARAVPRKFTFREDNVMQLNYGIKPVWYGFPRSTHVTKIMSRASDYSKGNTAIYIYPLDQVLVKHNKAVSAMSLSRSIASGNHLKKAKKQYYDYFMSTRAANKVMRPANVRGAQANPCWEQSCPMRWQRDLGEDAQQAVLQMFLNTSNNGKTLNLWAAEVLSWLSKSGRSDEALRKRVNEIVKKEAERVHWIGTEHALYATKQIVSPVFDKTQACTLDQQDSVWVYNPNKNNRYVVDCECSWCAPAYARATAQALKASAKPIKSAKPITVKTNPSEETAPDPLPGAAKPLTAAQKKAVTKAPAASQAVKEAELF